MNSNDSFAISATGMHLEKLRANVASMNLANAHTIAGPDGNGYKPRHVVAVIQNAPDFNSYVTGGSLVAPSISVEETGAKSKMVLQPDHPYANLNGYITYPGVDNATEMMTMMSAIRSYEANVAAFNFAKSMAIKALDIGGNS
jgi:flagellar basal-body rod protein FlgC